MEHRKQFTFYRSFYEAVMKLPKVRRLDMLLYIIRYGLDGVAPGPMTSQQEGQFKLIKPVLDTGRRKAKDGAIGGKISKRGPAKKISKKEIEIEKEIDIETETKGEDEGFRQFWDRYPLKVGQAEARSAWGRVCEKIDIVSVLSSLEMWIRSEEWGLENGRFIPKPGKWLREGWYERRPRQAVPTGATGQLGEAELEAIQRMLKET